MGDTLFSKPTELHARASCLKIFRDWARGSIVRTPGPSIETEMDEDGVDIPAEGAPVVFGEIELAGD